MHNKVEIVLTDHGRGHVYVDGEEVQGVVGIQFETGVNQTNRVSLTFLAKEVRILSDATVLDNDSAHKAA